MSKPLNNTMLRARKVQELTAQHYEPGRHDRCKRWVFKHVVFKVYPMSERTFFRLLSMDTNAADAPEGEKVAEFERRQMKLF